MSKTEYVQKIEKEEAKLAENYKQKFPRPLLFGDREQIALLRSWDRDVGRLEERKTRLLEEGKARTFRVHFTRRESDSIEVEAIDEEHARDIFWDEEADDDVDDVESIEELT